MRAAWAGAFAVAMLVGCSEEGDGGGVDGGRFADTGPRPGVDAGPPRDTGPRPDAPGEDAGMSEPDAGDDGTCGLAGAMCPEGQHCCRSCSGAEYCSPIECPMCLPDGGRPDAGGMVICGGFPCPAGTACCPTCDGRMYCAGTTACPPIFCPMDAGPPACFPAGTPCRADSECCAALACRGRRCS